MPEVARKKRNQLRAETINHWLRRRNQIIIDYCRLSALMHKATLPEVDDLKRFCQFLIDYVSAGHFEVYEQIANQCETYGAQGIELLNKHLPEINRTTDSVVTFNDKYGKDEPASWSELDRDLSYLGEAFAKRVDLEDQLIDTLRRFQ